MKTAATEMLGIEFPIFAFSHCRDVVAAVSRAGGLGVLGAVAYSPEQLELELKWIDEHVDGKPYGVDTVIPAKYIGRDQGDIGKEFFIIVSGECSVTITDTGGAAVQVATLGDGVELLDLFHAQFLIHNPSY